MRWQTRLVVMMLTVLLTCSPIFVSGGCARHFPATRTEVEWLDMDDTAPWPGFLLSERMLQVLYEDASSETAEDIVDALREKYGREDGE